VVKEDKSKSHIKMYYVKSKKIFFEKEDFDSFLNL